MWVRIVGSLVMLGLLAGCASVEARAEQVCVQAARALNSQEPQQAALSLATVEGLLWRSDRPIGRGFNQELADQMSARCPYELGAVLLRLGEQEGQDANRDLYRPYLDAMRTASPDPTLLVTEPRDDDGRFSGASGLGWGVAALIAILVGLRVFEVAVRAPARRRQAHWAAEADAARERREAREAREARESEAASEACEPLDARDVHEAGEADEVEAPHERRHDRDGHDRDDRDDRDGLDGVGGGPDGSGRQ